MQLSLVHQVVVPFMNSIWKDEYNYSTFQCPFEAKFGRQKTGTKVSYYDPILDRESHFFIDEIYSYDVYEDTLRKAEQIEDINMRENVLENYDKALGDLCPKGKNLAVIKYETVDNTQLRFMMKVHLEAEPVHNNSGTAIGFISKSDDIGLNGYKPRECVLQPVDKDFSGKLEIELFSRYLKIPEETVRAF